jgi:exopolyphosphatase/pppGpp-phosphohydrolase
MTAAAVATATHAAHATTTAHVAHSSHATHATHILSQGDIAGAQRQDGGGQAAQKVFAHRMPLCFGHR